MIAACDMILRFRDKKCTPVPFEKYSAFVWEMSDKYFYKRLGNPLGVPVYKIMRALNTEISDQRFRFISCAFLSRKRLEEIIENALSRDIPVIVRIGANGKKLPYKIYFPTTGNVVRENKMSWHYITVTGIENDILTFYSWGGKGKIHLSDLRRFFGFTGGAIIPK